LRRTRRLKVGKRKGTETIQNKGGKEEGKIVRKRERT